MNIEKLNWSTPTAHEGRWFRTAPMPDDFWIDWKDDRNFLTKRGVVPYEDDGVWKVAIWTDEIRLPWEPFYSEKTNLPPLPTIETKLNDISLLEPQIPHVQHLARTLSIYDCEIDPSMTGGGKTVCSLFTAHNLGLTPVVLCPKAVIGSWKKWMLLVGIDGIVINYDQVKHNNFPCCKRTKKKRPAYMQFEWCIKKPEEHLIIFDEGHVLSGEETLNSCMASSLKRAGIKSLILSATLAEKVPNLKAVGYLMGLHNWNNWNEFCRRHGYAKQEQKVRKKMKAKHGGWFWKEFVAKTSWRYAFGDEMENETMEKLRVSIYPRMGSRLTMDKMGAYMPEVTIEPMKVDVKGVASVYAKMNEALSKLDSSKKRDQMKATKKIQDAIDKGLDPKGLGVNKMTLQLRAMQEIELLKVPVVLDMANKELQDGNSVIIICKQRATIDALNKELGGLMIHGDIQDRQKVCDQFQHDEETVICLQSASGGTGISLHDEKEGTNPRVVFIFPEFNARTVLQALGRGPRVGGRNPVRQYIVYDKSCPEEVKACKAIEKKIANMNAFNGATEADLKIL